MAEFIVVHSIKVAKDFTPETFGRLTTIGPWFSVRSSSGYRKYSQVCVCSCGNTSVHTCSDLRRGDTKSCGCLGDENRGLQKQRATTHGMSGTPEHLTWKRMVKRCYNKNCPDYPDYGGRGISVHPDWRVKGTGFQAFFDCMGPKPTPEHSIDRYPNPNGNYEPGNVRWATIDEQARNKRNNVFLTCNGKTQCAEDWAKELGMQQQTMQRRLARGWTAEEAILTPVRKTKKHGII